MTESPDLVALYLAALAEGARADDPRLFALLARMTPGENEAVKQRLIDACVRTLPPDASASAMPEPRDCADLYVAIVTRGARPDDPRLAMLRTVMSGADVERAKATIAELWLGAEPAPQRPH
jgi:hypothetical protein